jgi:serine protease Do
MRLQRIGRGSIWVAGLLGLALGLGGYAAAGRLAGNNPPATMRFADPNEPPSRNTFAPVVKKVLPDVVSVTSSKLVRTGYSPWGQMGPQRQQRAHGLGSGVIVSPEGYILTNNHVVDGASDVMVTLSDKREFKGRVVGTDAKTDIAVLKIDGAGTLPSVVIGDSDRVEVGDFALAVGNPFGVGQTVTMGIVSATGRANLGIEDYESFIQTDAPINPGNSGGALVNDRGELIGINTAILANGSEGNQGIGFAVPVSVARNVMDQILKHGSVTRAYIGVMSQDVTPALAQQFHESRIGGALIAEVSPASPAQRAGLAKGDIIMEVNGRPVNDSAQLRMQISLMQPGATVNVKVLRDGASREFHVRLAELPVERSN